MFKPPAKDRTLDANLVQTVGIVMRLTDNNQN